KCQQLRNVLQSATQVLPTHRECWRTRTKSCGPSLPRTGLSPCLCHVRSWDPLPLSRPRQPRQPPAALTALTALTRTGPAPPPLRIDPVQHPRERDHLPDVRPAGDPGDRALDAEPEAGVWEGPVLPEVEVPAVAVLGQALLADALE